MAANEAMFGADGVARPMKMRTFSGLYIDPLNPDPDAIRIVDIAHHLSLVNRYGGATRRAYSVAEHCCLGALFIAVPYRLAFLLHDASEYLLGDVVAPIKRCSEFAMYRGIEKHVQGVIADRFDIPRNEVPEIHDIDMRLRVTELRDLLGRAPEPADEYQALPVLIAEHCYNAEQMFLDAFESYGGKA